MRAALAIHVLVIGALLLSGCFRVGTDPTVSRSAPGSGPTGATHPFVNVTTWNYGGAEPIRFSVYVLNNGTLVGSTSLNADPGQGGNFTVPCYKPADTSSVLVYYNASRDPLVQHFPSVRCDDGRQHWLIDIGPGPDYAVVFRRTG